MTSLAISFVAVLVQLGLAVLGWGGFAPFFSHPPFVVIVAATLLMTAVAPFTKGNLSPGEREDRGNRWVFGAFAVFGILLAFIPAYTDRRHILTIDGETIRWIGIAVFVAGGVSRLWPVFVLGHRFSGLVAIQPGHTLVTTGIYRYVRNPSYLGLLLGSLGWALVFRAGTGIIITALMLVPLLARIRAEERLLQSQFGPEYISYRARTWRLIPSIY